jgi:transposase
MTGVILAIDLGKAKSLFCWHQTSEQTQRLKTVLSTPQAFAEALAEQKVDRVVIEVCDMAGWVCDLCRARGIEIQVANANGEGWRWRNVKNKCDRKDVEKLARMSAMNDLKLVHIPDRPTRHWRSLILYRHKLIERQTAIKNSIHALLVSEGRAMRGRDAWTAQSLATLRQLARPLEQCASKEDLWAAPLWMELASLDHVMEQIETLDQKLNELGEADERVRRLRTAPGIGPRLSELVVAIIDDPHRFRSGRQVGAYVGLTPRRYQSGQMDRSGRISKAGCGKLRKVLLQVAWGMLEHNAHGRAVFQRISKGQKTRRKQAREGRSPPQAVALARRVLVWCWAMLRDGSDWRGPADRKATTSSAAETGTTVAAPSPGRRRQATTSRRQATRSRVT